MVQIETPEAVKNVKEIAAVDGIGECNFLELLASITDAVRYDRCTVHWPL